MNQAVRNQIKVACRFYGGIKPLSDAIGINKGNLSRWLNGKPTMSDDKVAQLLQLIGLPEGAPITSMVHTWTIKRVAFLDLTPGLSLYFSRQPEICLAPWVNLGPNLKESYGLITGPENLYAITDGRTRAVLRIPRSLLLQKENYKNFLKWKNGKPENSVLPIHKDNQTWATGTPSIIEFDRAWGNQKPPTFSEKDVLLTIREEDVSFEEAIKAIKTIRKSRKKS